MDKQQAVQEIATRAAKMFELFNECVALADEHKVEFELPWGGEGCSAQDGYGAGATYYPEGVDHWNRYGDYAMWVSSTQTC